MSGRYKLDRTHIASAFKIADRANEWGIRVILPATGEIDRESLQLINELKK